jgi:chemotaxis protein MotB
LLKLATCFAERTQERSFRAAGGGSMAMPEEDPPPGVPEWVVTYGDMMSLLLTFFIMLVSLSEVAGNKKYLQVLESLQKGIGYRAGKVSPPGSNFPLNSMVEKLYQLGAHSEEGKGRGGVKTPQSVEGDDAKVLMQRHGKPIPAGPPVQFENGSAELSPEARRKLEAIAKSLSGKPNKIEIRGHTSSLPLPAGSPYASHFALSYARAHAAFEYLANLPTFGIERERMRLICVVDHEPPEVVSGSQTARVDRVEIVVLDTFTDEYVGPIQK